MDANKCKAKRNADIYRRHCSGESLSSLARQYNISNVRAGQIYHKIKKKLMIKAEATPDSIYVTDRIMIYENTMISRRACRCLFKMSSYKPTMDWFKTLTWSSILDNWYCGAKMIEFLKKFCDHENITLEP